MKVTVIGAGLAGCCASISALEKGAKVITIRGGLRALERDDLEVLLIAGDHIERTLDTVCEVSVTSQNETDHQSLFLALRLRRSHSTGSNHVTS